jgi:ABC-type transport system involved in cytochrome c biogenesis permease subunit
LALALPFVIYVLALIAYAVHFGRRTPAAGRAATTLLVAGALAHTFVIGMQTMDAGHVPFAGTTQAISTFVWLLAIVYLYTEVTTDERGLGVFVMAIIVALQAVPAVNGPGVEPQSAVLEHPLFWTHVSALLGAYACFGLAAVIGITYVLQFKEIKAKHLVFFFTRLPSLQVLDVMNSRTVFIGWALLTMGLVTGAVWVSEALTTAPDDPRVQAMSVADPKIFVALLTWALYTFQLVARRTIGWRGRRSAYLSAAGFAIVLLNFVLVSYFLTDSHNFGGPSARAFDGPSARGAAVRAERGHPHEVWPTERSEAIPHAARLAERSAAFPSAAWPSERSEALRPQAGLSRRSAPRPD